MTRVSQNDGDPPLEVVNVVGSGDIGKEVDLEQICLDADVPEAEYKQGTGSAFLRLEEGGGLVILYRSGKYIVRGGKDYEKLYRTNELLVEFLRGLGVLGSEDEPNFEINNIVFVGDLGRDINLQALLIKVGLENAEFEPEQFPGLVYRPEEFDCILLVFGSGKVSITGSADEGEAIAAYQALEREASELG